MTEVIAVYNQATGATEIVKNSHASVNDYVTHPMTNTANNVATSLTQAGVVGKSWYISYANWRVSGGAVGAANVSVTISDGATVIYRSAIPGSSANGTNLAIEFTNPIKITAGNAITYDIGASGTTNTLIHSNLGLFQR